MVHLAKGIEHVLASGDKLGEGPIWHPGEQALYWVDIEGHLVQRYSPAEGKHDTYDVGLPPTALGFRATGGLIMATARGLATWTPGVGSPRFVTDPEAGKPDARFNDGAVDPQGRFWAGTMSETPTSCLYRLDPDGSLYTMETGIQISNGIGWSPGGETMYYTDSPRRAIYAYDFEASSGALANRRIFVRTPEGEGVPDGLTVDSDGFVWSARWGGWRIMRYDPKGRVEREIHLPVACPTSCTFGGEGLDELYITSAWTALSEQEREEQPQAGDLFRIRTGVKGQQESLFAG
jgi:sugar lactone lactonase YvrE